MHGVNNGSSSLANWNRGYENVSLPGGNGHQPAPGPLPVPLPQQGFAPAAMPPPPALIAPVAVHPQAAWNGAFPAPPPPLSPLPPTGIPPGSPPAEARGGMIYHSLDGAMHSGHPTAPPTPAPAEENWFRPNSPTYLSLKNEADFEKILGFTFGSSIPAGVKEMTQEQAAATTLFKNNLEAFDPTGILRGIGEFGQAFRRDGDAMAANNDIHYMVGGAMFMPPGSYVHETSQVIHSHPLEPSHINNYPSDADYYAAYVGTKGNTGNLKGETMYHPQSGKFYYYEPKLDPATGHPVFHELVNPFDMGPPAGGFEARRTLPDEQTYGNHFINWPNEGGTPPAAP